MAVGQHGKREHFIMIGQSITPSPLYMVESLTKELLLFDGLARAGKGLVAPVLSNLRRIEYAQINNTVDQIAILWKLNLVDTASAAAFLRIAVDTCTYEQAIGRNTNIRLSDISSVYNSLDAREIIARTTGAEGPDAMRHYDGAERISTFITHFNMPMKDLWFHAFPALRTIITVRHPVDVIASWNGRGWGQRWGYDPLGFTPTPEVDGQPIPWFALDVSDEYFDYNPMNRNALCVLELDRIYQQSIEGLTHTQSELVNIVSFEKFATQPDLELQRIASWLNTDVPAEMPVVMARERVPRKLSLEQRKQKLNDLKSGLNEKLISHLLDASRSYEERWGIEPVS